MTVKSLRFLFLAVFLALFSGKSTAQEVRELDPVVYSLEGVLMEGDVILSVRSASNEACRYELATETNYLSIYNQEGTYFAKALRGDSVQYIYMGPKTVPASYTPAVEPQPLQSPVAEGAKWLGKGALISAGAGIVVGGSIYLANRDDPFAQIIGVLLGAAVTTTGLVVSWWSGVAKGVQVAMKNQRTRNDAARVQSYSDNSLTFVAQWVSATDVPLEIREADQQ